MQAAFSKISLELTVLPIPIIFSIFGVPKVIVPVLSNTIESAFPICSRDIPFLIIIPLLAALFIPPIIAIGVAKISEQGDATTNTDRIVSSFPVIIQPKILTKIVIGVNQIAYLSARR